MNPDKSEYIFLHRTFQEYFTALYLKYQIGDDQETGIELVKKYFWNYDWHETLTLMAGTMKQPKHLLKAILNTKDDIFKTQLLLAAKCAAECKNPGGLITEKVLQEIVRFFKDYPQAQRTSQRIF